MKRRSVALTMATCAVAVLITMTGASLANAGDVSAADSSIAAGDLTAENDVAAVEDFVAASNVTAAGSCYGNGKFFTKGSNTQTPTGNGYWKTTSSCNDINLLLGSPGRYVFVITVGTTKPSAKPWCPLYSHNPSRYTYVPRGQWTVVKSNVPVGTHYFICWSSSAGSYGYRAA